MAKIGEMIECDVCHKMMKKKYACQLRCPGKCAKKATKLRQADYNLTYVIRIAKERGYIEKKKGV